MPIRMFCLMLLVLAGCASTPTTSDSASTSDTPGAGAGTAPEATSVTAAPVQASRLRPSTGARGSVDVDITDVEGRALHARMELQWPDGSVEGYYEVPNGKATFTPGAGDYKAYVYVYDEEVPILVSVKSLSVVAGESSRVMVNLLEGATGKLSIRDFDLDHDLAIDRVELEAGTDARNPSSIPGRPQVRFDDRVLNNQNGEQWFKGELHAVSTYGGGKETVAELVRRAEAAGLDFLAITDLNTMAASDDPAFRSDKVVLIPALAWGSRENGIALVYGPGTLPSLPETRAMAQAECIRIQSQGGVFVVAHPCFSDAPWKWGLRYVNAIQVWNGPWRDPAPLRLASLPSELKMRDRSSGNLVYPIAAAAGVADKTAKVAANARQKDLSVSANDQAALFWDYELVRGQICSVVAGGMVDDSKIPMGQPVTWVRAANKSLPAIMEGLRLGRTFVGNRIDGVQLNFRADVLNDGKIDVGMGGAIPLNVDVGFYILVTGATGAKVQVLRNGHPILTEIIRENTYSKNFTQTTDYSAVYRLRVIRQPENTSKGYGPVEVLAMSSPIYAADIGTELLMTGPVDLSKTWVELKSEYTEIDRRVPGDGATR